MDPSDTGKAYDRIAQRWFADDFNRENGIDAHRRAIELTQNRGAALDVGCGCSGRFFDLFMAEGFAPEGIDVSPEMVRLASERHPALTIHHGDICSWDMPGTYDFISAWDSIWHVPLDKQEALISKLLGALNPEGVLIFTFGGLKEAGEHRDDFMGPEVYYSTLGIEGFRKAIESNGGLVEALEFDQPPEKHTYLIARKR